MQTVAQASIRRLFEQVRVLEAEAARRPPRRVRRDRAVVVLAAALLGAAGAGTQRAVVTRHTAVHVRALPAVAHLIDAPSERARALPVVVRRPRHRHVAPKVAVQHADTAEPKQVAVVARPAVVHPEPVSAQPKQIPVVPAPKPMPEPHVVPAAAPAPPAAPAPAPVAIGSAVVVTADEPVPAPAP